jgi:hypothetical protein
VPRKRLHVPDEASTRSQGAGNELSRYSVEMNSAACTPVGGIRGLAALGKAWSDREGLSIARPPPVEPHMCDFCILRTVRSQEKR